MVTNDTKFVPNFIHIRPPVLELNADTLTDTISSIRVHFVHILQEREGERTPCAYNGQFPTMKTCESVILLCAE